MNWQKSKNSILVLTIITICPEIINTTIIHLDFIHRTGFILIGLAAILNIWIQQTEDIEKITQVLEAKNIEINGFKPKLIKQTQTMTDD